MKAHRITTDCGRHAAAPWTNPNLSVVPPHKFILADLATTLAQRLIVYFNCKSHHSSRLQDVFFEFKTSPQGDRAKHGWFLRDHATCLRGILYLNAESMLTSPRLLYDIKPNLRIYIPCARQSRRGIASTAFAENQTHYHQFKMRFLILVPAVMVSLTQAIPTSHIERPHLNMEQGSGGVYMTTEPFWGYRETKGLWQWFRIKNNDCHDLTVYDKQISSFGPDEGVKCIVFDKHQCKGKSLEIFYPGYADMSWNSEFFLVVFLQLHFGVNGWREFRGGYDCMRRRIVAMQRNHSMIEDYEVPCAPHFYSRASTLLHFIPASSTHKSPLPWDKAAKPAYSTTPLSNLYDPFISWPKLHTAVESVSTRLETDVLISSTSSPFVGIICDPVSKGRVLCWRVRDDDIDGFEGVGDRDDLLHERGHDGQSGESVWWGWLSIILKAVSEQERHRLQVLRKLTKGVESEVESKLLQEVFTSHVHTARARGHRKTSALLMRLFVTLLVCKI
ncbi:uncharacterized protein BDR25DRAFT_349490 [Lindgomyces ingoldianus]|uniref:Uncharacterized protein n=1 Tax=Lindgomyces ingoldianus TaxID=673940 RepID=A0ACB6RB96_9PLEO|nr:uncharacterized protein BDR25DRAFT_349490 [Lindgomyces ingoldianus]KAF2476372.1 hypothetical protein BDR25DRAFT_349490 [Lindgomyces ingoldianus]